MFGFICGFVVGLGISWIVWAHGQSIEIQSVNQSDNTAGGDIVGRDKNG